MSTPRWTIVAVLVAGGCDQAPPVWFAESAGERGLDFEHVRALETRRYLPEIMGGGVALLDFDDDGALDVYLVQSGDLLTDAGVENRLFRNTGGGSFADVTERAGVGDRGYGMGAACGDVDGDGDTDLLVTNVGPNALFRNAGDRTFARATDEAGVGHPGWGTSASFFDPDVDGDLDLFVVNYVEWSAHIEVECRTVLGHDYCSPNSYDAPAADVFYRNDGTGVFTDASEEAGIAASFGNGLGISVGDFDEDGLLDAYVANDQMPNQLWRNRGDGTFEDVALLAGCAANMDGESEAGMGTVAVDVENDGDLDLFLTHLRGETNTLYVNQGGVFSDRTTRMGLAAPSLQYTGFGTGFADFDHDGRLDLFVANGAVTRNHPPLDPDDPYAEPNQLFRGVDGGDFAEVSPGGGLAEPILEASRGTAFGDLDGDGDVDVVVVDSAARVQLLLNVAPKRGGWIGFRVRAASGADALGARVRIGSGETIQWRSVSPATSYCSSNDPRVHFGLGEGTGTIDALVRWPDGTEGVFGPFERDGTYELRKGSGRSP